MSATPSASAAAAPVAVLLVRCDPWLVAIPTSGVRRALLPADAPAAGPGHRLVDGSPVLAVDLRPWLSSPVDAGAVVVLQSAQGLVAVVAGRCLHVAQATASPRLLPPPGMAGGPRLACISKAALGGNAAKSDGLAPFALWLDPAHWSPFHLSGALRAPPSR